MAAAVDRAVTPDPVIRGPGTAILVAGPPDSGVSAVAAALCDALPDHHVGEWTDPHRTDTPDIVVFVVSAAAPMTPSQAALLDRLLVLTGGVPVIAAVSKVDLHRDWAAVLEDNRSMGAADHVWVGVAADPDIGDPLTRDLIDAVRTARIHAKLRKARGTRPQDRRTEVITRRAELAQTRLRIGGVIRTGCAELRTELQRQVGALDRRGLRDFGEQTMTRIGAAAAEWDLTMRAEVDAILHSSGVDVSGLATEPAPRITAPPPQGVDPTEVRLTVLVGAMFGAGAALTVSRVLSGPLGGWAPAVGAVFGVGLALWVVSSRRLLAERAATLRWTADLLAGARHTLEERVASQILAAEAAVGLAAADRR